MHGPSYRSDSFRSGLVLLLLITLGMASSPPPEVHLWDPVGESRAPDHIRAAGQPWLIREQPIRFHHATLESLRALTTPLPPRIVVDLIDGASHEIIIESRTSGPLATVVLQGRLRTAERSHLTLVIKETVVAGTIRLDKRVLKVQAVGNGDHLLVEIDPEKLPPD